MRRRAALGVVGLAVLLAATAVGVVFTGRMWAGRVRNATPAYVGAEACAGCHRDAFEAWRSSRHERSMQAASAATVLGDFNNATFTNAGLSSTFFRRGGSFWVHTDGPDGVLADFEVTHTFGVFPLQQYLVALPGGRLQALSIAWDARRPSREGGRWFSLYPGERIDHTDDLHWTGREQNWNFMCADCHSTAVRKGYDAATRTFATTFAAMNVGCEACHGPGSAHIAWAGRPAWLRRVLWQDNGLTVHLDERRGVTWGIDPVSSHPVRSVARTTARELEVCAPCHSRRAQIAEGYVPGQPYEDFYAPSPVVAPLYEADGQQREEVYTMGSFLESRMAHEGVTCSDCHDPHGGGLRASGNALCTRCHVAARYDAPAHHFHPAASAGAACVACHMPTRTYMQIDGRRDHSLRVPRPDLSDAIGTPNACTACHTSKSAAWAAGAIRQWYGRDANGLQDFAEAFHAADADDPQSATALVALAASPNEPAVVRASAFARLALQRALPPAAIDSAAPALRDPDPLVRSTAVQVFESLPPDRRAPLLPVLQDPSRLVRLAAVRAVAPLSPQLTGADRASFDRAAAELVESARLNADRPETHVALATFFADAGRLAEAQHALETAVGLAPRLAPAYVNLADVLRARGDEAAAGKTLRQGLAELPASADLHYALGLSLARSKREAEALAELKEAAALGPADARFAYGYAVALHSGGQPEAAMDILSASLKAHPDDRDSLVALIAFERDAGRLGSARAHAARLVARDPEDREARAIADSLGR